jgi:hypothetical protein
MTDSMFEVRLERAARRYAEEAVRPIDAVAVAEAAIRNASNGTRERGAASRWLRPAASAAVVVVLGVAAISILLTTSSNVGPPPTISPSPSPSMTIAPTSSPVRALSIPSATWLAEQPGDLSFGLGSGPGRMALSITVPDPIAQVSVTSGPSGLLRSSFESFGVGDLRFTSIGTAGSTERVFRDQVLLEPCIEGDQGHYQSTMSPDRLVLALTAVTEDCPSRQAVLARTWARSLGVANGGGLGGVDAFDPRCAVTMPAGSYEVDRSTDARAIFQQFPEFQLLAFKDPQGFLDPCDRAKGRYEIAPGANAFVAYFRQLRGFTVDSTEELQVDGLRAVRLVVHANEDAPCDQLWEWQPKAQSSDIAWFLSPGVTDSLVIVDHPAGTLMFEVLPAPNSLEQDVISAIRFLDALPTGP